MTILEFSRDIIPIAQLFVSCIGVVGVILLWYQIKLTHKWNKANSQHSLLSNLPNQEHEKEFWNIIKLLDKDENGVITLDSAKTIYSNTDDWVCIKTFLNKFEQLCAAINVKALDDSYAYSVHSVRVTSIYHRFENYIDFSRKRLKNDEIYIELEVVASRWHERYLDTKGYIEKKLAKAKKALKKGNGIKGMLP